jgi:RNA-directed DNA polymerase
MLRQGRSKPTFGRNGAMLAVFREGVLRLWCRTLRRRSNRHRVTWAGTYRLTGRWLPNPRILHP